jgi:hypothetical protein
LEEIEPILVQSPISVGELTLRKGQPSGAHHTAIDLVENQPRIILVLSMSVGAQNPRDKIDAFGRNPVSLTIFGGITGDSVTAAIVVNCIPRVLALPPGLLTMLDVPCAPRDVRLVVNPTAETF